MDRDEHTGRFVKGNKANGGLGGRPLGLQQRCREATRDGADIVELMLQVLGGNLPDVKVSDRVDAAEWFADRGWGKATQFVEQTNGGEIVVRVVRVAGTAKGDRASDSQ